MKERPTKKGTKPDGLNVPLDGSHYIEKFVSDHIIVTLNFIPIEERMPEEGYHMLLLHGGDIMWQALWLPEENEWSVFPSYDDSVSVTEVTHWAEMPTT